MRIIFPFALVALVAASTAHAQDFLSRYPSGSITTRQQADQAIAAAQKEQARLKQVYDERDKDCYRQILVNDCREKVRRERESARNDVHRVELEAKDLKRKLDYEDLQRKRAEQQEGQPAADEARKAREAAARADTQQRQDKAAAAKPGLTSEEIERNKADLERKQQEHAQRLAKEQQHAAEAPKKVTEYEQKQADAAKRAEANAVERKKREERRAQRKQDLAKKEAEREALRKKAEEAGVTQ
ncbi:MAG TPA: hypothetical protein VMK32_01860 [Burkholderiaceae bacterium]|nr:hypothetical protein [Burkholderiaceae bacterium]